MKKGEYKNSFKFDNLKRSIIKYIDLYPSEGFGYAQYFQWVNYGFDFLNEENQYDLVHEVEVFLKSYQYVENAILLDTLITSLKEKIENYYNACERNYENNKLQLSTLQEEFTGYLKETEEMKSTIAKNKDIENELSTLVSGMMNERSSLNSKLEKNKYPFGFAIFLIILFFLPLGALGIIYGFRFVKEFGFDFEALTYFLFGIGSGLICFFSIFFIV